MTAHFDHELIAVKLDVGAIHESLSLIKSGITQGQIGWVDLGVEKIEAQIDRAVRLSERK